MPLKVVTGRANAGKTGWILGWAFEALSAGQSSALVVPNLADVRRLQSEISGKAPLGVRVLTLSALLEDLWQLHGDGRRLIGNATRAAVVSKILAEPVPEDMVSSARTPGFERLLTRAARYSTPTPSGFPRASGAQGLATRLLARYQDEIETLGLIEPGWIGAALAERPPTLGFVGFLRFTAFTESNLSLACSLAQNNCVGVALSWEEGFAPTRANDTAAVLLLKSAVEHRIAEEACPVAELDAVATRLTSGCAPLSQSGSVVFGEARGCEAEVALVASMTRAAIERGVRPERVAVVFGEVAPRLNLLRAAMAAEGIEFDVDCALTVGATAFGRAVRALLRLALGIGDRSEALIFLQGPFSDSNSSTALRLDSNWRRGRHADDSARILADIAKLGGQTGEAIDRCRRLASRQIDPECAQEWQILADALIASAAARGGSHIEEQDASAYRSFTRAISEMASVEGAPFGAVDVLGALSSLSCSMLSDESVGNVQVVEASRIGARRFDELIVAGLTAAEFPLATRESFASDVQSLVGGDTGEDGRATTELEFYSLLSRPRNQLTLVRQTVNSDGTNQKASPLLVEIQDLYRGWEGDRPIAEAVRCEDVRAFMPVFTHGRRDERLLPSHAIRGGRAVLRGALSPETAEHFSSARVFSATEIEDYLRCPYSWFYSRVLRPQDVDSELDAAALGSRAHRLLSDFYGAMKREERARVTPDTLSADLELFEQSAALTEQKMARAQGLSEQIDVGRAHLWARHAVEDDAYLLAGYEPYAHELVFGDERVFQFAGVALSGRIDRVDVGPSGAVVTDYKSARDVGKLVGRGVGAGIQHLLYALASEQLLGMPVVGSVYRSLRSRRMRGYWRADLLKSTPVEACEKDFVDDEGFSALVGELEMRVSGAIAGIAAGEIPRKPRSTESCAYCALNQICEGAL